mgnify:CR=1 FL=1
MANARSIADFERVLPAARAIPDHDLALGLWATGIHEARLLAAMVDIPAEVTAAGDRRFVRLGTLDYVLHREKAGRTRDRGAVGGVFEGSNPPDALAGARDHDDAAIEVHGVHES